MHEKQDGLRERVKRFVDELPDEIDGEEIEFEPEFEYKVLTVETEAASVTIEKMLYDDWSLDDHIATVGQVILIFSREKGE
ncbi:MAG: hypothetical protein J2P41_00140 [Blastocatellia bacterium]|nr:hypothetical protein [Blastocatellia bacterium]